MQTGPIERRSVTAARSEVGAPNNNAKTSPLRMIAKRTRAHCDENGFLTAMKSNQFAWQKRLCSVLVIACGLPYLFFGFGIFQKYGWVFFDTGTPFGVVLPGGASVSVSSNRELIEGEEISRVRRAKERRLRTRPPPQDSAIDIEASLRGSLWPYNSAWLDEKHHAMPQRKNPKHVTSEVSPISNSSQTKDRPKVINGAPDVLTPASFDKLCGSHAKAASLKNSKFYLARDALNPKSRVMITGILSSVGFHLALALREICGVKEIIGIDSMFPNSILHRLEMKKRIELLQNAIPELSRPIIVPFTGLDQLSSDGRKDFAILPATGEVDLLRFRPTHIVHLASVDPNAYRDVAGMKDGLLNTGSPYASNDRIAPLFQIRQASVSMEHILASVSSIPESENGRRPHITFSSSNEIYNHRQKVANSADEKTEDNPEYRRESYHETTNAIDELLATRYYYSDRVYSVGLRLSSVYGPMGKRGNPDFNLAHTAVDQWHTLQNASALLSSAGLEEQDYTRDFVFVDDVVDAIISAMQYRRESPSPPVFKVASGEMASLFAIADAIQGYTPGPAGPQKGAASVEMTGKLSSGGRALKNLGWSPRTSLKDGIAKLIAWHLERKTPFGPTREMGTNDTFVTETGDQFLSRQRVSAREEDWSRLRGRPELPCASDCSRSMKCAISVFDNITALTKELTAGCDIVFYAESWDSNAEDVPFETRHPSVNVTNFPVLCNLAFVSRSSPLVEKVVSGVTEKVLKRVGLGSRDDDSPYEVELERRIDALNGRLFYKGWILVWLSDPPGPLLPVVKNLLKLSPGKLFAPTVKKAVYGSGNFTRPTNYDDVYFLAKLMRRKGLKKSTTTRVGEDGEEYKITLPAEPSRHAIFLAPGMLHPNLMVNATVNPTPNIPIVEAMKAMLVEKGRNPLDPSTGETPQERRQREFYAFVTSIINRKEFRSSFETKYIFEMKHWIRSKSIVHDFEIEESRQFRCEWYQEHSLWGNDLDQLSFAGVMARREIERQLIRHELDEAMMNERLTKMSHADKVMANFIEGMVDWREWHSFLTEREKNGVAEFHPTPEVLIDDLLRREKILPTRSRYDVDLFVRVATPKAMAFMKKTWDEKAVQLLPPAQNGDFSLGRRTIFAIDSKKLN